MKMNLKALAKLTEKAATEGASTACYFLVYQPKLPQKLAKN